MFARSLVLAVASLTLAAPIQAQDIKGPWNFEALKTAPKVTWVDKDGPLRRLDYESEPVAGKPTRVFAYCAFPEKAEGTSPAMVLVGTVSGADDALPVVQARAADGRRDYDCGDRDQGARPGIMPSVRIY